MSKLSASAGRAKPVPVETTRSHRTPGRLRPPPRITPKPDAPDDQSRLEQLVRERPKPSVLHVFLALDRLGRTGEDRGDPWRGTWVSLKTLAYLAEVPESTVRTEAIPWLVENGWLLEEDVLINGRFRRARWCLWMMIDMAGRKVQLDGPLVELEPPGPRAAGREKCAASRARAGARAAAPTHSNGIPFEIKDDDRSSSSCAAPGGEIREETPPAPPPPTADPETMSTIEAELPGDDRAGDRAGFVEYAAKWRGRFAADWVAKAIRIALTSREPIRTSIAHFVNGVLENCEREGHPPREPRSRRTPKSAGGFSTAQSPPAVNGPTKQDEVNVPANKVAVRQDLEGRRIWESLDADERATIQALVDLEPPIPGPPKLREMARANRCHQLALERSAEIGA